MKLIPFAVYGVDDDGVCLCREGAACESPGKHPKGRWRVDPQPPGPGDNYGLPTGPEAGYVVLDIDNKPDRDRDGLASIRALVETHGNLPPTLRAKTGSGGYHVYFSCPKDRVILNSVDEVASGLDVRGAGGFVVAPPSKHTSGGTYEWVNEGADILPAPEWLLDLMEGDAKDWAPITDEQARKALASNTHEQRIARAKGYLATLDPAIEGQGGDRQTFRAAKVGYSFGIDQDTWLGVLSTEYNPRCEPPWTIPDLKKKVANAYNYTSGAVFGWRLVEPAPFDIPDGSDDTPTPRFLVLSSTNDVAMATGFLENTAHQFLLVDRTLMIYRDCQWTAIEHEDLQRILISELEGVDADIGGKFQRIQLGVGKLRALVDAVCLLVASETIDQFEARRLPGSLSVREGIVTVARDGDLALHPHSIELAGAQHLDVSLKGAPEPKRWIEFLGRLFAGDECETKTQFVREYLGAAMTGLATEFDLALVLYGRGSNGKSTFLQAAQRLLFNTDLCSSIVPERLGDPFALIGLRDVLLNSAGELPNKAILESSTLKAIVSGDIVSARRLQRDFSGFKPRAAHIFATNSLPNVTDSSDGFWRRAAVLRFDQRFDGEQKRDEWLKLFDDERAGIVRWALQGLQSLRKRGHYLLPQSSIEEQESWKDGADPINSFVQDVTLPIDDGSVTPSAEIYRQFQTWFFAYSGGQKPKHHMNAFIRKLKDLGIKYRRTATYRGFAVTLKESQSWEVNQTLS